MLEKKKDLKIFEKKMKTIILLFKKLKKNENN